MENRTPSASAAARLLKAALSALALIGGITLFHALIHDEGIARQNRALLQERDRLEQRNQRLTAAIAALYDEIERLQDPKGEESLRFAQAEMGMIRSGEIVYRFEERQ